MFILEEIIAPEKQQVGMIYRRDDGLFEGRIYLLEQTQRISAHALHRTNCDYYLCAEAKSPVSVRHIMLEELGFPTAAQSART